MKSVIVLPADPQGPFACQRSNAIYAERCDDCPGCPKAALPGDAGEAVKFAAAMWAGRAPGTPTLTHEQIMALAHAALAAGRKLTETQLDNAE